MATCLTKCYIIPETFQCSLLAFIAILRFSKEASIKGKKMVFVEIYNKHIYRIKSTSTCTKKVHGSIYHNHMIFGLLNIAKII